MRRAIGALLLTSLALAATACGGSSKGSASGGESAATLIPQSAVAFVALNTDLSSGQWKTVDGLLQKFPARDQLLASIRSQLTQQGVDWEKDVKPALGKELDVAVLSISGSSAGKTDAVAFLKPNDEGKLNALLEKGTGQKPVHEKIEGWTAIAQSQSTLDEIKNRKGKPLSDDSDFSDAMGKLPSEAVAKFYVAGTALQQALSQSRFGAAGSALPTGNFRFVTGAIEAKANGFKLSATTKGSGTGAGSTFRSQFLSKVPAGAYAFISFRGSEKLLSQLQSNAQLQQVLPQLEQALGVTVSELASLFTNEGALWVRQGTPIPEVTLALKVDNQQKALSIVDRLAQRAGALTGGAAPRPTTIAGVSAKQLPLGKFSLFYAAFDGNLVITTAQSGISGLKQSGSKLADDATFKEAKDAAGMPDSTSGFLYLNLKDSIPLIESLAQLGGQNIPSDVQANLAPLHSFLAYAKIGGGEGTFTAFLEIK